MDRLKSAERFKIWKIVPPNLLATRSFRTGENISEPIFAAENYLFKVRKKINKGTRITSVDVVLPSVWLILDIFSTLIQCF